MTVYCLTLQYDGTRYNGWQKQGNTANTIQEKLETLLSRLYDMPLEIAGSGRTDAGVHALGQTASFSIPERKNRFSCKELTHLLNQYLPEDIRILKTEEKDPRFHARLLATSKIYEYRIDLGPVRDVFQRRYSLFLADHLNARKHTGFFSELPSAASDFRVFEEPIPTLDLDAMKKAAGFLIGTHDFCSFCDNKRMKKSTVRTLWSIQFEQQGHFLILRYHGNGFLYHMVRILTGTLLDVGLHLRTPEEMPQILSEKERTFAGPSVPPQGLFLCEVSYEPPCSP